MERYSRQRKDRGYYVAQGKKPQKQNPARPHKEKWSQLAFYKEAMPVVVGIITGMGLFLIMDALFGTHLFGPPAFIGMSLYVGFRIVRLRRKYKL